MEKTDKNTIYLREIDSSNNYAKQLISTGKALHGTAVLAYCQTGGRGHAQNHWESEAGKNLLVSLILLPRFLPAEHQFYLSKITSLALVDLLSEEKIQGAIKWPNDIYTSGKKIAGILIENSISGQYIYSSVAGVGLNLNQTVFSPELPNPVSLRQITGKEYSIELMAERLKVILGGWYRQLKNGQTTAIDSAYYNNLSRLNQWALYKKKDVVFEGRIRGIGEYGQLILEDRSGNLDEYLFKEIEFVL